MTWKEITSSNREVPVSESSSSRESSVVRGILYFVYRMSIFLRLSWVRKDVSASWKLKIVHITAFSRWGSPISRYLLVNRLIIVYMQHNFINISLESRCPCHRLGGLESAERFFSSIFARLAIIWLISNLWRLGEDVIFVVLFDKVEACVMYQQDHSMMVNDVERVFQTVMTCDIIFIENMIFLKIISDYQLPIAG